MRKITNRERLLTETLDHVRELLTDEANFTRAAVVLRLPPDKWQPSRLTRAAGRIRSVLVAANV